MRMNHTRGLPASRPDRNRSKPAPTDQAEARRRHQLNCVSNSWHRQATEMYRLREQEREAFKEQMNK